MGKQSVTKGGLQVKEDRAWQEKFWTAQRVGWAAMVAFLIAALAGLTGLDGPLASGRIKSQAGTIEYPRISRWQASDDLMVRLPRSTSGEVELMLSDDFAEIFSIESIEPEPSQVVATPGGHRYTFAVGGDGGGNIAFHLKATSPSLPRRLSAAIDDSRPSHMTVTVLP